MKVNNFTACVTKECFHILRDKITLTIMIIMPVVLLLILGFSISMETKNISYGVLDFSSDINKKKFLLKLDNNKYFNFITYCKSINEIETLLKQGKIKVGLIIRDSPNKRYNIQAIIDSSDPNESANITNYLKLIYTEVNSSPNSSSSHINYKLLYNPQMKSAYNIVPGMIGIILLLISTLMTSVSVTKEKETGTLDLLFISPLKPGIIIIAKAIPYLTISFVQILICLLATTTILDIEIKGNIFSIMFLSLVYTFTCISLGLLISVLSKTQQEAIINSGVGLMLPSLLLSDIIFPVSSMPITLQFFSYIIPTTWYVSSLKDLMIKGYSILNVIESILLLLSIAFFLIILSIKNIKTRS